MSKKNSNCFPKFAKISKPQNWEKKNYCPRHFNLTNLMGQQRLPFATK